MDLEERGIDSSTKLSKKDLLLLKEHSALVKNYIHEDNLANKEFQSFSLITTALIGIITWISNIGEFILYRHLIIFLGISGGIFGLFWSFLLKRIRVYQDCRIERARKIENEFHWNIFADDDLIHKGKKVTKKGIVDLSLWEKAEMGRWMPILPAIIGIFFLIFSYLIFCIPMSIDP